MVSNIGFIFFCSITEPSLSFLLSVNFPTIFKTLTVILPSPQHNVPLCLYQLHPKFCGMERVWFHPNFIFIIVHIRGLDIKFLGKNVLIFQPTNILFHWNSKGLHILFSFWVIYNILIDYPKYIQVYLFTIFLRYIFANEFNNVKYY